MRQRRLECGLRQLRFDFTATPLAWRLPSLVLMAVAIVALLHLSGCERQADPDASQAVVQADDLAAARKDFVTKLRVQGPAPQPYENEPPPPGVRLVEYPSGDLKLKGWLSADPGDGKRRPAVVYLHGGWAFAGEDWRDGAPFVDAGFVLFMPMLRGENGNPGNFESFYGEVDDAVAAGRYVASLPQVDNQHVFVVGHSVGAVLATLSAMVPSPYEAAAALSGYMDMETWAAQSPDERVPFDRADRREVALRNPLAFARSLRCPLTLYVEPKMRDVNALLATRAQQAGKECQLVVIPGDHLSMVAPAVEKAIEQFRTRAAKPTSRPQ